MLLVRSGKATVFNPDTSAGKEVERVTQGLLPASEGYLYTVQVGEGGFLSLGNEFESASVADVFWLTLIDEELQIKKFPPMSLKRSHPGIVLVEGKVMVFGGVQFPEEGSGLTILAEAEELPLYPDFPTASWSSLPPMPTPRAFFTPCEHNSQVYLCGGLTPYCERFSPSSLTYTRLWISLYEYDGHAHCAFVYDGALVVLSQHWMMRWKLEGVETSTREIEEFGDVECRVGPVLCGRVVFLGTKGGLKRFNVEEMEGSVV